MPRRTRSSVAATGKFRTIATPTPFGESSPSACPRPFAPFTLTADSRVAVGLCGAKFSTETLGLTGNGRRSRCCLGLAQEEAPELTPSPAEQSRNTGIIIINRHDFCPSGLALTNRADGAPDNCGRIRF